MWHFDLVVKQWADNQVLFWNFNYTWVGFHNFDSLVHLYKVL